MKKSENIPMNESVESLEKSPAERLLNILDNFIGSDNEGRLPILEKDSEQGVKRIYIKKELLGDGVSYTIIRVSDIDGNHSSTSTTYQFLNSNNGDTEKRVIGMHEESGAGDDFLLHKIELGDSEIEEVIDILLERRAESFRMLKERTSIDAINEQQEADGLIANIDRYV